MSDAAVVEKKVGHTPGPWEYEGTVVWIDTREQVCCGRGINECCGNPDVRGGQEQIGEFGNEDDARLAAAAPEMLEALKAIASHNNAFLTDGSSAARRCLDWCVETARAAIAKAEGR